MSLSLAARWILPVSAPPLSDGVLVMDGERLVSVAPRGACAVDVDLGDVAVVPGLVNAHTHLDLTGMVGLAPPSADFPGWLRRVIGHRRSRTPTQVLADVATGIAECVRFGTTLVGDISGGGESFALLAESPLRAVVFRELLGLPAERAALAQAAFRDWLTALPQSATCRPGISPHAPYSVRRSLYAFSAEQQLPLATHLAESKAELELLQNHAGPFVDFLQQVGVWSPEGLASGAQEVLQLCGPGALVVHGNYLPEELQIPAGATLVYCPRTHAAFEHAPHPYRRWLQRGLRVALGTDGLASNPDLNMLAEARLLLERDGVPGDVLLRMLTLSGAEALGWASDTGSLDVGKSADLVVVRLGDGADVCERVIRGRVERVMSRGAWVPLSGATAVPAGPAAP